MSKTALITGITGQDGSYLSELLLDKGYKVVGLVSQDFNIGYQNVEHIKDQLIFETGDLLDTNSLENVFEKHKPDEVYNLAGLTFVPASWDKPTLTFDINALGVSRILELIAKKYTNSKFYQASSSRIFGNQAKVKNDETTTLDPLDPYSVSKVAAHLLTKVMREHFDIFACSGILFNHESERRGVEFVTRKITHTAAQIKLQKATELRLGNLDAKQDWGYAPDYVEAMWLMLQQNKPEDYVIATGQLHTVREICEIAFSHLGLDYTTFVKKDEEFFRKEVQEVPVGDSNKALINLGWKPKVSFEMMIVKMVEHDLELIGSGSDISDA